MGKLFYYSILAYGHQNTGIMLGNHLLDKYGDEHEIYVAVDETWYKRLQPSNPRFHFKIYKNPTEVNPANSNENVSDVSTDPMVELAKIMGPIGQKSPMEQVKEAMPMMFKTFEDLRLLEPEMKRILDEVKPDLILLDQILIMPCIIKSNIPWALVMSCNPLVIGFDHLPPAMLGLRINETEKFKEARDLLYYPFKESIDRINEWLIESDCLPLRHKHYMCNESPYFNIYIYPKELDYFEATKTQLPGKWLHLESSIAPSQKIQKYEFPEEFLKLPGKLIYFSMGSLFSAYLPMMQRLLNILGELPYKFVVSKGSSGDKLQMPSNCWGENWIDQKALLNSGIDLCIIHGGNNSTNEAIHFGVPAIILPLFCDQHDNATRLEETGMGRSLKAFDCTKEQLHEAIESILNDEQLVKRWKQASVRIQKDNGTDAVTEEILKYLNKTCELKN